MIKLIFIRHGATAGNLERRYIGRTDEPLCAQGMEQVKKLQDKQFKYDYLFVSPLLRTRQTAELLFPGKPYTVVADLAETDFGMFEGKNADELTGCKEYQAWVDSMCLAPIPGGESVADFKKRCISAFAEVMKTIPDNCTAVFVVHGGTIMSILEAYSDPPCGFYDHHIGNGQYICCDYADGKLRVHSNR